MTNPHILLDPTAETSSVAKERIARPASLDGLRIGLLDIAKMRGDEFLDRIEERLRERGHEPVRYRKASHMVRASNEQKQKIRSECDVVIEALAD